MRKFRKAILLFVIVTEIIFILPYRTQNDIYASAKLDTNNRNILNVAVLLYSFDDLFTQQLRLNLEEIQKENKDRVRFTFYDGKNNIAVQHETLDYVLNRNTDLIFATLADVSEESVKDVVLRVKQKNVPIVLLEISPQVVSNVSKDYDKAAFLFSNTEQAGIVQGKILVDLWNTNKSVLDKNNDNILEYVLLQGKVNNPIAIERIKNVISTISNSGIQMQQLQLVNADWSKELAKNSVENLFLKYGNKIEAIISNNDAMAIGAIEALQRYGYNKDDKSKNIAVVGIDALPEAKALVDKGIMIGTVIQESKAIAEAFYKVGMNLEQNLNPVENTNYKIIDGEIMVPISYEEYVKKS